MENKLGIEFNRYSLMKFVIPNIIMMVFLSLYTIVDGIFISRFVGTIALSATNIVYPLISLELSVGIMLSTGTAAIVSKLMGEGQNKKANESFTFIFTVCIIVGMIFLIFGNIYIDPILKLLGTTTDQYHDAKIYITTLLYFAPSMILQIYFQYLMSVAGEPGLGLKLTILSGVLNIALDYIFMKPLKMGIFGAAFATGIGYVSSAIIGIIYFLAKKEGLRFTKFTIELKTLLKSTTNGSSEMISNLATAVTTFMFNIAMIKYYGDDGVAAITIVFYFQFLFSSIFLGYSAGVAPIIGYKYGEQNSKQLKKVIKISFNFILLSSILMYIISTTTLKFSLNIFIKNNPQVYEISRHGFKIFAFSFLFTGFPIMASAMFTAFSNGLISAVISFARTFGFILISIALLPKLIGVDGLWLTIPAAEFLSMILSAYYYFKYKNKYKY